MASFAFSKAKNHRNFFGLPVSKAKLFAEMWETRKKNIKQREKS
jgi:hypothetical protein